MNTALLVLRLVIGVLFIGRSAGTPFIGCDVARSQKQVIDAGPAKSESVGFRRGASDFAIGSDILTVM